MSDDCSCCEAIGTGHDDGVDNPPGQSALTYRVGTHATFLRAMVAELGRLQAEGGGVGSAERAGVTGCLAESHRSFLPGGEPEAGTALLDGWACIADVLTFYQERIVNEGYLRTATERRSLVELSQLIGYQPRPGVAASAHLAFSVQEGFDGEIPAGTRTQSMPRPGSNPQIFETSEAISARAEWNLMLARRRAAGRYVRWEYKWTKSQSREGTLGWVPTRRLEIFVEGVDHGVTAGAVMVLEELELPAGLPATAGDDRLTRAFRVTDVWPADDRSATTLRLIPFSGRYTRGGEWDQPAAAASTDDGRVGLPFRVPPRARLGRAPVAAEPVDGEDADRRVDESELFGAMLAMAADNPQLHREITAFLRSARPKAPPRAYVLRATAQVFGHNAAIPVTTRIETTTTTTGTTTTTTPSPGSEWRATVDEADDVVFLDGDFPAIKPGGWVAMWRALVPNDNEPPDYDEFDEVVTKVVGVSSISRRAYDLTGKATRVQLGEAWWTAHSIGTERVNRKIFPFRTAVVYAQSEPLALVGEPLADEVSGTTIELEGYLQTLPVDRLLVVEGERIDLGQTTGLRATELARVSSVEVRTTNPPRLGWHPAEVADAEPVRSEIEPADGGARPFTRVVLTAPLAYRYKRSTVTVRGNVAHATHGETRDEVLGSGDAALADQRFLLKQAPRTWVSAPTPTGIASTLTVRVDRIAWPEVPNHAILGPRDEVVRVRTRGDDREEVRGGDGRRGARFTTGIENVTARYRVGIGAGGNVDAGLVTSLVTRPLGVREVTNPLPASGGADADGADALRMRMPISARSSDRLVSVRDHADFALNFAGIQSAHAHLATSPTGQPVVSVVIAGAEGVPIDEGSDLLTNLRIAFRRYGDPSVRVAVRVAEAVPLMVQAKVRIDARYLWSDVEPAMRAALLAALGWERRQPGQAVFLSAVLAALHTVPAVVSVDVDRFGPLTSPQRRSPEDDRDPVRAALVRRIAGLVDRLRDRTPIPTWRFRAEPWELFYISSSLPAAVALQEVTA